MTTEQSPEWLIENADHGIAFEVACAAALTRLLAENAELQRQLEAIGAGGVGPLRRPLSAWIDKLITAGLYAISLGALICAVMVAAVAIGGAL